ncbi:MAG: YqeG family HAD IIIA-type phosphatase [Acutalibacteraceae bacterium]
MALLKPTVALHKFDDVTIELLRELDIDTILLDVDNTLSPPSSQLVYDGVHEWLDNLLKNDIHIVICSNNYKKRVQPFADKLGLPCVAMSLKPFPFGFNRAKRKLKRKPKKVLVVGDQIYTDILGANLAGMKSVLLVPQSEDHGFTIAIRRKMERKIRQKLYKT